MNKEEFEAGLNQFYGTEQWHSWSPIFRNMVLTDGALYVAENAGGGAFWLMDMVASHILAYKNEHFGVVKLKVDLEKESAVFTIDDGDGKILAQQKVGFTDFPLESIKLYVVDDGERWVILLPSEY